MKKIIHHSCFETNSSSAHCLALSKHTKYGMTINQPFILDRGNYHRQLEILSTPVEKFNYVFCSLIDTNINKLIEFIKTAHKQNLLNISQLIVNVETYQHIVLKTAN